MYFQLNFMFIFVLGFVSLLIHKYPFGYFEFSNASFIILVLYFISFVFLSAIAPLINQ